MKLPVAGPGILLDYQEPDVIMAMVANPMEVLVPVAVSSKILPVVPQAMLLPDKVAE
jgi:hypothetical protein